MTQNGYDFYLDGCLLPVTPQKLEMKINNGNKTITLINGGEVNILKTAGLTDVELECMLPQVPYPFAVYQDGFRDAHFFLDYFEALKTCKRPFRFIVCRRMPQGGALYDTNMRMSMEDYKITEDAKEGFDVKVKIKLKQWRDYGTKTASIAADGTEASIETQRETDNASTAQTYEVRKGDCLWNIAKKFYGNGSQYTVIYHANKELIGGSPNLIYPGQVLIIPDVLKGT